MAGTQPHVSKHMNSGRALSHLVTSSKGLRFGRGCAFYSIPGLRGLGACIKSQTDEPTRRPGPPMVSILGSFPPHTLSPSHSLSALSVSLLLTRILSHILPRLCCAWTSFSARSNFSCYLGRKSIGLGKSYEEVASVFPNAGGERKEAMNEI